MRGDPQIRIQAKQERRTSEYRKREGGFRTTPPKPEKPHTIPILPLDANAITRHQSKYITFRHIDAVPSRWFRCRQKNHSNHHITCQQHFHKTTKNTPNKPLAASNSFQLLWSFALKAFHPRIKVHCVTGRTVPIASHWCVWWGFCCGNETWR